MSKCQHERKPTLFEHCYLSNCMYNEDIYIFVPRNTLQCWPLNHVSYIAPSGTYIDINPQRLSLVQNSW